MLSLVVLIHNFDATLTFLRTPQGSTHVVSLLHLMGPVWVPSIRLPPVATTFTQLSDIHRKLAALKIKRQDGRMPHRIPRRNLNRRMTTCHWDCGVCKPLGEAALVSNATRSTEALGSPARGSPVCGIPLASVSSRVRGARHRSVRSVTATEFQGAD